MWEPCEWQLLSLDHEPKPNTYTIAFRSLQQVCSELREDAVNEEHQALFSGKTQGFGAFSCGDVAARKFARHVSALQSYLAAAGVSQVRSGMRMEKHVSAVCDVMRRLIIAKRPVEHQLAFFNEFVRHTVSAFCAAVETHHAAYFFREVAMLGRAFIHQEVLNLECAPLERC